MRSLGADLAVHRMREMLERDLLGPAEPAHQEDLETLLDVLRASIELEGPCDYAEGPSGVQTNRRALQAHFPGLAGLLEQWDRGVERVRAAPDRLWEWLAGAAAARGIAEPPFAVGALIDRLAVRTVERSRTGQSAHPHELSIQHFKDVVNGQEHLSVYVEGQKVARLAHLPEADMRRRLESTEALIQGLFDDAQRCAEAAEILAAHDALFDLKQQLLDRLAHDAAISPIPVAPGCPVCEGHDRGPTPL